MLIKFGFARPSFGQKTGIVELSDSETVNVFIDGDEFLHMVSFEQAAGFRNETRVIGRRLGGHWVGTGSGSTIADLDASVSESRIQNL